MSQDAFGNYQPALSSDVENFTGARRIRCRDMGGASTSTSTSTTSTTTTTTTPAFPEPPVPEQLYSPAGREDTNVLVGVHDFDLDADGIVQVNVYRATDLDGPFVLIGNFVPPDNGVYIDDPILDTQQYYYQFTSVGDGVVYQAVESDHSETLCALLIPQNLQFVPGSTTCDVTWDYSAPNPLQDWQIQWSTDPDFGTYTEVLETNTANHSQALSGLAPETDYLLRIRARDSNTCYSEWNLGAFSTGGLPE